MTAKKTEKKAQKKELKGFISTTEEMDDIIFHESLKDFEEKLEEWLEDSFVDPENIHLYTIGDRVPFKVETKVLYGDKATKEKE